LHPLVSQLSKEKHSRNYIHVHSTNSNYGTPSEEDISHQVLEKVEPVKTVKDLTMQSKDEFIS
jgi:hypothetical protein